MSIMYFVDRFNSVESSVIDSVAYSQSHRWLFVTLNSGATYIYSNVDEGVYNRLIESASAGTFWATYIQRHFGPARREDDCTFIMSEKSTGTGTPKGLKDTIRQDTVRPVSLIQPEETQKDTEETWKHEVIFTLADNDKEYTAPVNANDAFDAECVVRTTMSEMGIEIDKVKRVTVYFE